MLKLHNGVLAALAAIVLGQITQAQVLDPVSSYDVPEVVIGEGDTIEAQLANQDCCLPRDCCCSWNYATINVAAEFLHLEQGGFNNLGGFANGGASDTDESYNVGFSLGKAFCHCDKTIRVEVQAMYHDMAETMAGRFIDDFGFFDFTTSIEDRWTVTGNVWYDIHRPCKPYDIYFGGGIGVGGGRVAAMDPIYMARASYTDFVWQVGAGIIYHTCHNVTIDLGYRYIDYGGFDLPLVQIAGNVPAGNYTSDMTAHQIMLGIRFDCLGNLLSLLSLTDGFPRATRTSH